MWVLCYRHIHDGGCNVSQKVGVYLPDNTVSRRKRRVLSSELSETGSHHNITGQKMYVLRDIEERSRNHFCSGKAINTTYSECVSVTIVIQNGKMRHIVICGLLSLQYFSKLSHKRDDFRKKRLIGRKMCVLIFSTNVV
jgi:hypothetical protein